MNLAKHISQILNSIPKEIEIVAATKYVEASDLYKLLALGISSFGENRVESFINKYEILKNEPICWHFIGHLQTNKAKKVLPYIKVLHSLDSIKLAECIEKYRKEPLDCYIEININQELSKNGILASECINFIKSIKHLSKVHIVGLMMMTTKESTYEEKKFQFLKLRCLLDEVNERIGLQLKKLSMGMSDDYQAAIEAGTTTLRLGRILWEDLK